MSNLFVIFFCVCVILWPIMNLAATASEADYYEATEDSETITEILFPAESDRHERTFMSWPEYAIWGKDVKGVQSDIVRIAHAIAQFEPVTVLVSPRKCDEARKSLGHKIQLQQIQVDDLWARDTLPVFTLLTNRDRNGTMTSQALIGVNFNFNGWGQKQKYQNDGKLASQVLRKLKIKHRESSVVTEGGSLETDGAGTLLVTESSIINKNRNPGKSKNKIEEELKAMLGVKKIIWFKGVAGKDITDAHVDSIARFTRPGRVIVSRPHPNLNASDNDDDVWVVASNQALEVLSSERDANGRKFEIIYLYEPNREKIEIVGDENTFVSTYVNFYVINGAVIMPKFGDEEADKKAQEVLKKEFPDREIVAVKITTLASGGGGIHCATHELPYVQSSALKTSKSVTGIITSVLCTLFLSTFFLIKILNVVYNF